MDAQSWLTLGIAVLAVIGTLVAPIINTRVSDRSEVARTLRERQLRDQDYKRDLFVRWLHQTTEYWLTYRDRYDTDSEVPQITMYRFRDRANELRVTINALEGEILFLAPDLARVVRDKNSVHSELKKALTTDRAAMHKVLGVYWRSINDVRTAMREHLGIENRTQKADKHPQLNEAPDSGDDTIIEP